MRLICSDCMKFIIDSVYWRDENKLKITYNLIIINYFKTISQMFILVQISQLKHVFNETNLIHHLVILVQTSFKNENIKWLNFFPLSPGGLATYFFFQTNFSLIV